jgi:predicted nucleic acid-binding protein
MTRKLEDLLNLPENQEIVEPEVVEIEVTDKEKRQRRKEDRERLRDMAEFDKIAEALPAVKGLGQMADEELNEIADKAIKDYNDLMY